MSDATVAVEPLSPAAALFPAETERQEIDDFLTDNSADGWEKVIDRLLASPQYGERWGRHWMDVVRYADTAGDNADYPVPEARLYRDYIIDSFNADKPYDQFVREQVAGDLLAAETLAGGGARETFAEQTRGLVAGPVDLVARIAQRVVAQISEKVVREVAWEVIPELAEALINKEIARLKAELQNT